MASTKTPAAKTQAAEAQAAGPGRALTVSGTAPYRSAVIVGLLTRTPPAGGSVKQVISDTKHLALTPY